MADDFAPLTGRCMCGAVQTGAFSVTAGEDPDDPTVVAIRMGCLDQDPGIRPQVHRFVNYASPLEPLPDDGPPRFAERLGATEPL